MAWGGNKGRRWAPLALTVLVISGCRGCAFRYADAFDKLVDLFRDRIARLRDHEGHCEVDHRTDCTKGGRLDGPKQWVSIAEAVGIGDEEPPLVQEDVDQRHD